MAVSTYGGHEPMPLP